MVIKIYDGLTRETAFIGKCLLSDREAIKKLFLDAEAKGFFLK
jgi:hypothetical protein